LSDHPDRGLFTTLIFGLAAFSWRRKQKEAGLSLTDLIFSKEGRQNLKASIEELGKISSGVVEGLPFPNASIRVVTGQMNQENDAILWARQLSIALDGREVSWTCHGSMQMAGDFSRSFSEMTAVSQLRAWEKEFLSSGHESSHIRSKTYWQRRSTSCLMDPICHLAEQIMADYEKFAAQAIPFRLYILAHSRGAIELLLATKLLPSKVHRHLYLYTLGAAYLVPKADYGDAVNYANALDPVYRLAKQRLFRSPEAMRIVEIPARSKKRRLSLSWQDHYLSSPGYCLAQAEILQHLLSWACPKKEGEL
jgi:hypothetical protein